MKKISAVLFFLIICFCLFAEETSPRVYFPSLVNDHLLPESASIGQVDERSKEHAFMKEMLGKEFTYEWVVEYIPEDRRKAVIQLFGSWLAENLPMSEIVMSVGFENADSSVSINVKGKTGGMCFCVLDHQIIAMGRLK